MSLGATKDPSSGSIEFLLELWSMEITVNIWIIQNIMTRVSHDKDKNRW